jgi:hypothetical protein
MAKGSFVLSTGMHDTFFENIFAGMQVVSKGLCPSALLVGSTS